MVSKSVLFGLRCVVLAGKAKQEMPQRLIEINRTMVLDFIQVTAGLQ